MRLAAEFGRAPAQGDGRDAGKVCRGRDGVVQVAEGVRVGLDEDDVRPGGDGVGPFHVHGFLVLPVPAAIPGPAGSVPGRLVVLPNWLTFVKLGGSGRPNVWSNSARSLVLKFGDEVSTRSGVVVGIHDGDRLTRPIAGDRSELDVVDPVRGPDLLGRVSDRTPAAAVGGDRGLLPTWSLGPIGWRTGRDRHCGRSGPTGRAPRGFPVLPERRGRHGVCAVRARRADR